jgi:hypothetical protein
MSFIKSTIECRQSSFCGRGRAIAADVQAYPDAHRRSANLARIPNGLELFVVEPAVARRRITDDGLGREAFEGVPQPRTQRISYVSRTEGSQTRRWRKADSNLYGAFSVK